MTIKLTNVLRESIRRLEEEDSPAAREAKKKGLEYASFGRWKNPKTGKVVAQTADGGAKLIPFKGDSEGSGDGDMSAQDADPSQDDTVSREKEDRRKQIKATDKERDALRRQKIADFVNSFDDGTWDDEWKLDPSKMARLTKRETKEFDDAIEVSKSFKALAKRAEELGYDRSDVGELETNAHNVAAQVIDSLYDAKVAEKRKDWDRRLRSLRDAKAYKEKFERELAAWKNELSRD